MKRNLTSQKSLPLRIPKPLLSPLFGLIILSSLAFVPLLVAPPGLTNPEPVGAYLNGKFPKSIGGDVDLVPAYPNLLFDSPLTWAVHPHDNKVFVGQRDGKVYYFEDEEDVQTKELFIDMSDRVGVVWDGGFLGFAFHPNFGKAGANGRNYFFTYYSTKDQTGANSTPTPQRCPEDALYDGAFLVLQRFEVFEGTLTVDESKTIDMFKVRLYNSTHRGGGLIFGKDGLLYLTTGDQAQHSTAQELSTNLDGGILRFDVDMDPTRSHPPTYVMPKDFPRAPDETSGNGYYIPNDNPYVGLANTFEEYYAIGLRNPHRMTMDRLTGTMYIGDIGAGTHEEINVVGKAKNYGWPVWEGPVRKNTCTSELYNDNPHQLPLTAFPRSNANSIIGGYVYRGTQIPDLYGTYICGDWGGGTEVWTIDTTSGEFTQISSAPARIISFGEGKDGELYVLTQGGDRQLLRMESSGTPNDLPQTLSETGAFTSLANLSPAEGLIPYEMYESFWSDHAEKKRWLIVPNDGSYDSPEEKITYSENDIWRFPEGTMFIKHFELPIDEANPSLTKRLETRFTIVGKDKKVYGVTYKWRTDGSDADLVSAEGLDEAISIRTQSGGTRTQVWHYPGRSECLTCHTEAMGGTLGPRTRYLNTDYTYPSTGTTANQLVTLSHLGVLDATITDAEVDDLPRNATQDDPLSSLQTRARSYLDLNCSYCHQPFTGNRAVFDARISTPIHLSNLFSSRLNESLGIEGEQVITPGDTGRSVLYKRIHSVLPSIMMPPLAKAVIDQEGADLVAEWIQSMDPGLEVEECIPNLALNKPTRQSSTGYSGISARAVDGNRNGIYGGTSVTHTNTENQPWWEVDLESPQLVTDILLFNRTDCCTNRLSNFYVITSETPFVSDDLDDILNQPGVNAQFYGGNAGVETIISVNQSAQYIRVHLQNRGILSLAEVEVTSCPQEPLQMDCRNIALGKTASQSSMFTSRLNFEASNAIDGNTMGFDTDNSMTHTLFEQNAWWEVDLAESYPLTGIKLWNRDAANCCEDRLSDFYVISSNVPFTSQDLSSTLAQEGVEWIHYQGTAGRETFLTWENEARYVRVQLAGTNALSLAEVEIYTECFDQPRRDCEPENYALGKPATQSSNWNAVFTADKGVDGDTDGFDENGTMTHTRYEFQPWWELDLEEVKEVDQIQFWNRDEQDCSCYDRLTDFYVISSPVPFASQDLATTLTQPEVTWVRHKGTASSKTILDWNQQARYVRFQLNGTNALTLAEVAVMGCKEVIIPDTEAPSIPQNILASDIQETGLDLNWNASTDNEGVEGYYVYQDGNATPIGTVSDLFFTVLGLEPGSTHLFAVAAFDSAGNVSAQSQAIEVTTLFSEPEQPTHFFAHWPLDDDTNDAIGDADGVLQGGATLVGDAQRGKVLSIANNGEHVLVPAKPQLQVGKEGQDFSVAFWMKLTQDKTGAWRSVMHKGEENYQRTFAMWMRPADNRLHYRISTDASSNEGADSRSELPLNEWTHIAYVKEGQSLKLYFNGIVDHEVNLRGTTLSNVGNLYFGDTPWYVPAQGRMDDIRLYGYAISPAEISDLMLPSACANPENLALNKATRQSSTYSGGTLSGNAVDGNTDGNWSAGSLANTRSEGQPWWEVDLGANYDLKEIHLWNRLNCCADRLSNFYVFASTSPFDSEDLQTTVNDPGVQAYHFEGVVNDFAEISLPVNAQYIRIQRVGSGYLHIAEMEVYECDVILAPKNLQAVVSGPTQVDLSWEASSEAAGYYIYQEGSSTPIATVNDLSYVVEGLEPGTTYEFSVAAYNAEGNVSAAIGPREVFIPNDGAGDWQILLEGWEITEWSYHPGWHRHFTNEVPIDREPEVTEMLTSFEMTSNILGKNTARIRGYITAPQTGDYTFWVSSYYGSELWLSTDENPVKGNPIAQVFYGVGYQNWNRQSSQQSLPISLEAGQRYYVEAIIKLANNSNDHFSVGWQLPDGTLERPISGAHLSPYEGQGDAEVPSVPGTPFVTDITSDGVSLKWNHSTDDIGVAGYYLYQDGNAIPVDTILQGDSVNVFGLGESSTHLFAVAAFDVEGNLSGQSQAMQVTTEEGCNKAAIYYDDFEEGTGIWNLTGSTSKWANRADLSTSGNYVVTMSGDTDSSYLETYTMDLERFEELTVDFTFLMEDYYFFADEIYLQVSTDGGATYRTVESWDYRSGELYIGRREYHRITFNGPFSNQTRLRFNTTRVDSRWYGYVHFDDISIEGCEVEGCEGTQNLALGRTARQSSTYGNGVAGLAVDGNLTGTSPWSADLQHTNNEAQPWWEVDLEVNSKVDSVRIHNRSDCCTERQKDFYVLVSDQPMAGSLEELLNSSSVHAIYYPNQAGAITTFPVNAAGRYVRIQLKGSSQMHLAEVEVLGCNLEQICVPPVVSIDDPGVIAEDGQTIQLSASPEGGTWSGASTDGSFDPAQGAGLYEVIYTYEAFAGCSGADTLVFEVLPAGSTCDSPTNLALGQSVSQSSTYGQGLASLAVDGNRTGTSPWSADLQHTTNEAQPWWQVDLGQKSLINSLDIYNRSDALPDRLNNFYVLVSDLPISSSATLDQLLADGSITQVFFSGAAGFEESISLDATGRYVRIQLSGSGLLHLAEVEVMGCALGGCVDPVVSIENIGPFAEDAGVQQLMGQPAGGVWSGSVSATGIFDPSQGVGSYEVIYSYTDGQGCSNSAIESIDVLPGGGCASPENLALNKSASQSSTYGNGVASLATDGIQNGTSPWSADLAHSTNEAQPWWEVDLGGLSNIQQVKIYNRTDCCFDRLRDFYILSSSTPFAANASLDQLLADPNVSSSFISGPATIENIYNYSAEARYVRIQLSGSGLLHIAEVEVWGCTSENDPCFGAQSAVIDPIPTLSPGSGAIQLSASPAGGEWSGVSTDGSFDPGNCPGSYEVVYTYLNGGVCVSADTTTILVQSDTMDVFIYAGQSNATGVQGASQNLALGSSPYDAQISYAWNIPTEQSSNGWDILQPLQVGANQQGHGAEISFGRLMFSMGYNNLGIIKVAEGGTSLAGSWDPTSGLSGYNATSNQGMYPEMLSYVNARLAELDAQGQPYRLAGVLWHQGEGDMNATMADAYKDNLIEFVNILRSDLGSDLQVFAASVYNSRATTEDEETVRKAQRDAAAEVSGLFVVNLDSVYYDENFNLNTVNIPDGLHYNSQGQVKVGNAFASAYQTFYPLAGCGEGPSGICPTSENLALNQPASQSSTYGNGLASLAVDGNTVGSSPWTADLQHTTTEAQPWWQVDLGAVSTIEEVKIYNRSDCCAGRLNNFYILLSDDPFDPSKGLDSLLTDPAVRSINFSGAAGLLESINIAGTGRYVRIQHTRETQLHLAEVEVWGCGATGQGTRFFSAQEEDPGQVDFPSLSIFPNPTRRSTTIHVKNLKETDNLSYGLYNMTGQKVWSKEGGLTEKIDVQGLAKGVYLLKVQAGEWSEVKQLVIN